MIGYLKLKNNQEDIKLKSHNQKNKIYLHDGILFSDEEIVSFDNYKILLNGKITKLFSNDFDLHKYINKQEEVIFKLYKKYGDKFVSLIDGFFLIMICDENKKILLIYNDCYNATNLYYYLDNELFAFASNLKELLNMLPRKPEFDQLSVPTFLGSGFSSTEKTQFRNIYRLLPTVTIKVVQGKVKFNNHWKDEFKFDRKPFDNLEKHLDRYEKCFQQSIKNHIDYVKPKRIGVFLSGGHDTSLVYIQISKTFKKKLHAFTASFEGFGFDETPKAKAITQMFGGIFHRIPVGPKHLDLIPQLVRATEEPVSGSSFPCFVLAKEASKYVDTVFTGDPGDTLWGEYYPVAEWHKYLKHVPFFMRKLLYELSKGILKISDWERFWELEHVLSVFATKNIYENFMQRLCTYRHFNDKLLRKILNQKMFPIIKKNKCMINVPFTKENFSDALIEAKMLYGVYAYNIPICQRPVKSFGLKFYAPYLNKKVIDFINSLPEEWLNDGSSFKKIFNDAIKRKFHKMVLRRYLPDRLVYGIQQSLDVPWHVLFNKRPKILTNLLKRLKKRGWYNNKELERIFYEFPRQKVKPHEILELKHHGYRIYSLLTFEVWCMEFLDNFEYSKKEKVIPLEDYLSL